MKTLHVIHFQSRVPLELFCDLDTRLAEQGVDRMAAYERLRELAIERSRKTCAELHRDAAGWTAEQWAALGVPIVRPTNAGTA